MPEMIALAVDWLSYSFALVLDNIMFTRDECSFLVKVYVYCCAESTKVMHFIPTTSYIDSS